MDWSNWTEIRDQSFPSCYFDCEPEINYSGNNREHDFTFEETFLNEQACDQVRRILLGKENAEILKLEKDVTTLEKQLAWADVSWSQIDSVPLSEKVKSLDLSIRNFKVTNLGDDRIFGENSLAYRELLERWLKILKLLPEKYIDQKTIQLAGHISDSPSSDLTRVSKESGKDEKVSKGTKGDQSEKKTADTLDMKIPEGPCSDIQMNESDSLLEFVNQKREQLAKRNPKDRKNKGSTSDLLLRSQKPKSKKVLKQRVKVEYNLDDPQNQSVQLQRKSQNSPEIEKENKLKSLNDKLTQSSSMESLQNINFSITDAWMEETPGRMDFSLLKMTDLKNMAKFMNLQGYWKLTKAQLIEQLKSKVASKGNCT